MDESIESHCVGNINAELQDRSFPLTKLVRLKAIVSADSEDVDLYNSVITLEALKMNVAFLFEGLIAKK